MRIEKIQQNNIKYKGALDGAITQSLMYLNNNPMANATLTDLTSMVIPRTYIDTKKRNKYAGAETFFREFTGTGIVCLSSGVIAKGIGYVANKIIDKKTKINPNSWITNDGLKVFQDSKENSNNAYEFVKNIFTNISGQDGNKVQKWNNIEDSKINWVDEEKWNKIKWNSNKFSGIHKRLKTKDSIIKTIADTINNNDISKSDKKNLSTILEARITNVLQANKSISVKSVKHSYNTSVPNLIRDTLDFGKNILNSSNSNNAINKLIKINKSKTYGAIAIASSLGLINQYVNRKITEKRTGVKGFVGNNKYNEHKSNGKDKSLGLKIEKGLTTAGIVGLALGVMKVKNPKDFVKKLEFTGPVTSGNAIKTVYTATLAGRFLASDDKTELRETSFRDYFGFLNWLVLGDFVSKGVANLMDKKKTNLFNINKKGIGLKHWFNDISLKNHKEIVAKGENFAKKNIWKANLHQVAGLAYSTTMLGVVLPLLNIYFTKKKENHTVMNQVKKTGYTEEKPSTPLVFKSFYH